MRRDPIVLWNGCQVDLALRRFTIPGNARFEMIESIAIAFVLATIIQKREELKVVVRRETHESEGRGGGGRGDGEGDCDWGGGGGGGGGCGGGGGGCGGGGGGCGGGGGGCGGCGGGGGCGG
jgi:hypothetical protein